MDKQVPEKNNSLNYMFEIHLHKPFEVIANGQNSIEIFHNPNLEINSYHMGLSNKMKLINSKKISTINLNIGVYHKEFYHSIINIFQ